MRWNIVASVDLLIWTRGQTSVLNTCIHMCDMLALNERSMTNSMTWILRMRRRMGLVRVHTGDADIL